MLGQAERVEAELLGGGGQRGRCQVAVGQGGGDAQAHGQDRAGPWRRTRPGCRRRTAAPSRVGERGLLAPVGRRDRVAPGRPHERGDGPGGAAGVGGDARGQRDGLVEHGARARTPAGPDPSSTSSSAPTQSEVSSTRAARCQPMAAGNRRLLAASSGHPQLGERHPQACAARRPATRSQWASRVKPSPTATPFTAARRGTESSFRHVEQPHEALPGALDGGAGGDGGHLRQVLARGEGAAAAGQHHGADAVVVVVGGAQGGRHLLVHGGVEGVAHLGPVERHDPDAGCGIRGLDPAHGRSPGTPLSTASARRAMTRSAVWFSCILAMPADRRSSGWLTPASRPTCSCRLPSLPRPYRAGPVGGSGRNAVRTGRGVTEFTVCSP